MAFRIEFKFSDGSSHSWETSRSIRVLSNTSKNRKRAAEALTKGDFAEFFPSRESKDSFELGDVVRIAPIDGKAMVTKNTAQIQVGEWYSVVSSPQQALYTGGNPEGILVAISGQVQVYLDEGSGRT